MSKPTQKEIQAEIETLRKMKPTVRDITYFGDSNHDAIDAQIEVLSGEVDEDEIDDKVEDGEWAEHVYASARNAVDWMNGDSDDVPSEEWKELVIK